MQISVYDSKAKCAKCGYGDISTQYVKGGRYGDPCEFFPHEISEREHQHRHCRRCGYEWCEECLPGDAPVQAITSETVTGKQKIAALRPTIDQLRQIGNNWADLLYTLDKFSSAYDLLLSRYAKFQIGDRVQLSITPVISETMSPGWLGSKHFLVAGAIGTTHGADVRDGKFYYWIVFDAESWIDSKNIEHVVPENKRHSYCFSEDYLIAISPADRPVCFTASGDDSTPKRK